MRSYEAVREAVSSLLTNKAEVYEPVFKGLQHLKELIPAVKIFK